MPVHAIICKNTGRVDCIKTPVTVTNPLTHDTADTLGLWDTGATYSCITSDLANTLNLQPVQKAMLAGIHGAQETNIYWIRVTLDNPNITIPLLASESFDLSDDHKTGLLIGMDVITQGDFCITNHKGNTVMTFRTPSLETVNYEDEIMEFNRIMRIHKLRSLIGIEKCPCGSGKLFKDCCGISKYNI